MLISTADRPFLLRLPLIALLFLPFISACSDDSPTQIEEPLRPVKTLTLSANSALPTRQFPGVVDANQKAVLSFRVSGTLEKLIVNEGDQVTENQVIAKVETTDFEIELADHQAIYDRARADYERGAKLVEAGHVSRADFDKLKSSLASAKAQLESTKQKLVHASLKAPFSGIIAKRFVDNFEEVAAQEPIFLLQDTSALVVRIDIPQNLMINAGQVRDDVELFAEFEAIPDERFPLGIKEVATVADEITQTYSLTLSMPAIEGRAVLPGMSVIVSAQLSGNAVFNRNDRYYVPAQAVMNDTDGNYVFVLNTDGSDVGTVERRKVKVGSPVQNGLEILEGLEDGERLIVAGMSKLSDGQQVRAPKAGSPAPGKAE